MRKIYATFICLVLIIPLTGVCQSVDINNDGLNDKDGTPIIIENPVYKDTGDVLHTIPIPSRYCWALAWDGEALWTANYVTKTCIRLDPETGEELASFPYPSIVRYIDGMAWDGEYLWATGWYESNGNGSHIFKFDTSTGEKLNDYFYPSDDPWPHGLAFDGQYLWSANYIYEGISTMDIISTVSGNLMASYDIIDHHFFGLSWDGNSIWTADMDYYMLYEMRYPGGIFELEVNSPCGNPRDMAWDGEYLWVLSWETKTIYKINVGPAGLQNIKNNEFKIYPNPTNRTSVINFIPQYTGNIQINLINITGTIKNTHYQTVTANHKTNISLKEIFNTENLHGLYLIEIIQQQNRMARKVIF